MSAERPIHWPEEDLSDGRGYSYPDEPKNVPLNYIESNQSFWKKARRGKISRPAEIPSILGNFLHDRITKTFGLDEAGKPSVVWSVVFDNPKSPNSKYVYERRYPEDVPEEDRTNYAIGIERINEYATNYATREFIRRNTDVPILKTISKGYRVFSELMTYALLLKGTYMRMMDVEILAKGAGKDFGSAILEGLFNHNFGPINELIEDAADLTGFSNLNEMAIEIGRKKFTKPNIGKILGKLEANKTDGNLKRAIKNGSISVAAGGVFRTPGVVEISAAMIPFAAATDFAISEIYTDSQAVLNFHNPALIFNPQVPIMLMPNVIEGAVGVALAMAPLYPFIAIHESIHHYSGGKNYIGFIPANLVYKETTPHKAKFEGE